MEKLVNGMSNLAFAEVINGNADDLGTENKIKYEYMTADHLRNTLNEQLTKVESDTLIDFKTEGVQEIYNNAVGGYEPTPVVLTAIEVTKVAGKTIYTEGEKLDLDGLEVTATYSDGTTKDVTESCIYDPEDGTTLTADDDKVDVSYTEGGVTKTDSFELEVTPANE